MRYIYFLLLSVLTINVAGQGVVEIIGKKEVCEGVRAMYRADQDFVEVEWVIFGSNYFTQVNDSIEVFWGRSGNGEVVLKGTYANGERVTSKIEITINPNPKAVIIDELGDIFYSEDNFDDISQIDTIPFQDSTTIFTCSPVCENIPANYRSQFPSGSGHQWVSNGGQLIGENSQNAVTVDWESGTNTNLQLFLTNEFGCKDSTEICISVFEKPAPNFEANNSCIGGDVYFQNTTQEAKKFLWDFGDGIISTETNPVHAYGSPGEYLVKLLAYNEYNCADSVIKPVTISDKIAPTINCVGPACFGAEVLYNTSEACAFFSWNVIGGTIKKGQGTKTIEVGWDQQVTTGILELEVADCEGNLCPDKAIVKVPIITDAISIKGEVEPCAYGNYTYHIDPIPGVQYNWSIEGSGEIISQSNLSNIVVNWYGVGSRKVKLSYFNPTLNCSGNSELQVNVKPQHFLSAPTNLCAGETGKAYSGNSNSGKWSVVGASIENIESDELTIKAGFGNRAIVTYENTDPQFCKSTKQQVISVTKAAPPVDFITGDSLICIGKPYRYETNFFDLNSYRVNWRIEGGSIKVRSGNYVDVEWTDPNGILSASLINRNFLMCPGDTSEKEVSVFGGLDIDFSMESSFCTYSDLALEALIDGESITEFDGDFKWTIIPEKAGVIVSGQYTQKPKIQFNDYAGSATVKLEVEACGNTMQTISKPISIKAASPVEINISQPFCVGSSSSVTTNASNVISWEFNGDLVSTNNSFNISQKGAIVLNYIDNVGCKGSKLFEAEPNPIPRVIGGPSWRKVCQGDAVDIDLFTLDAVQYNYQWSKNGTTIPGAKNHTLNVNSTGEYNVLVSNNYGCQNSRDFSVFQSTCNQVPPNCFQSSGEVSFTMSQNCNEITFTNTSSSNASNLRLQFGDGDSYNFTSPGEVVVHEYKMDAGEYLATLLGNLPGVDENGDPTNCSYSETKAFILPLNADFFVPNKCDGREIYFEETSSWIPGNDVTNWEWNFGDPSSGSNNFSNSKTPSHRFSSAGSYTVSLRVSNSECSQTSSQVITVTEPIVDFDLAGPLCINTPISILVPTPTLNTSIYHEFDFDGTVVSNFDEFIFTFKNVGTNNITLSAIDEKGCSNQKTLTVNVNSPQNVSISVLDAVPICEGDSAHLSAPNGVQFEWSNLKTTKSIYAKNEGKYGVTLIDDFGCLQIPDPIEVGVNLRPKPVIFSPSAPGFCNNVNGVSVDFVRDHSYAWKVDGVGQTSLRNTIYSDKEGDFVVAQTDDITGCEGTSKPFNVEKHQIGNVELVSDVGFDICEGRKAKLEVDTDEENLSYYWNTNASRSSFLNTAEGGTHFVTVTNEFGCSKTTSKHLQVYPMPNAELVMSGCFEACDENSLPLLGLQGFSNTWYKEDNNSWNYKSSSSTLSVTETGSYRAIVKHQFFPSCKDTSRVSYVKFEDCAEHEEPPILVIDKNKICIGDEITIECQSSLSPIYLEYKMDGGSTFEEFYEIPSTNFTIQPTQSGTFRLRAYSGPNAPVSNEISIDVLEYPDPGIISSDKEAYCEGDTVFLLLKEFTGSLVDWEVFNPLISDFESLNNKVNPVEIVLQNISVAARAKLVNDICVSYSNFTIDKPDKRASILDLDVSHSALCSPDTIVVSASYEGEFLSWQKSVGTESFDVLEETQNSWVDVPIDTSTYVLSIANGVCPIARDTVGVNVLGETFNFELDSLACVSSDSIHFFFEEDSYEFELTYQYESGMQEKIALNKANNFSLENQKPPGTFYFSLLEGTCYQEIKDSTEILPLPQVISTDLVDVTCFGLFNGSIEVETSLGLDLEAAFNWTLTDSTEFTAVGSAIQGLRAGIYNLDLSYADLPRCKVIEPIVVGQPQKLNLILENVVHETCEDYKNGLIELKIEGGTAPFEVKARVNSILIPESQVNITGNDVSVTSIWPGVGEIEVVDAKGCISILDFEIESAPLFSLFLDAQLNPLCANESTGQIKVGTTGTIGNAQFEWSDGESTTDSSRIDLPAGLGSVKIITELGCVDSIDFNLVAPPEIELEIDSIVNTCIGEKGGYLSATAKGGTGNLTFNWSNNVSGKVNAGIASGTYRVTVTDKNGCSSVLDSDVKGKSKPIVDIVFENPTCGKKEVSVEVKSTSSEIRISSGTSDSLDISLENSTNKFLVSAPVFGAYNFELEVNNDGCIGLFQDSIIYRIQPTALFVYKETKVDLGYNFTFENLSINGDAYLWDFGGSAEAYFGFNPDTISLSIDESFAARACLEVSTTLGCVDEYCMDLYLQDVLSDVLIPNSFTPDGDGVNDVFVPIFSGIVPIQYTLEIWSRMGVKIFSSNDPEKGWDGKMNGQKVPKGTYVYIIKFLNGTSKEVFFRKGVIIVFG
ncbi:PKD domain-containing protein [Luteibaculum oceani]|uniref:PKD domain-containing protein n=1 Tax=Luteibaculum oceani TaxID=1294296 RepID=A0A5C6UWM1_9FLAO|nr:PKD domain-containing protein [Luteibaculum oceani]TXC76980.1 PKD domain-containing protein [Luteibaculum oceani]